MKKTIYYIAALAALVCVSSCNKMGEDDFLTTEEERVDKEMYVDGVLNATSTNQWHYFRFESDEFVLVGKEDELIAEEEIETEDWSTGATATATKYVYSPSDSIKNLNNWDIAISRYMIRTNSGESGNGNGGIYVFPEGTTYESITSLPSGATFVEDETTYSSAMGNDQSWKPMTEQIVFTFGKDADGNTMMPPVYEDAPQYAFRTADGERIYAVDFISYLSAMGVSGYVSFQFKEIN